MDAVEAPYESMNRRQLLLAFGRASLGAAGLWTLGCASGMVLADGGAPEEGGRTDARDPGDAIDASPFADGSACRPTRSDVLGPFHRAGAPSRTAIASPTEAGVRLALGGIVLGADCATPLAGATLDVWQADATGAYPEPDAPAEPFRLRGMLATAPDGTWALDTIRPGNYRNGPGWRPAHLHFIVSAPGHRALTTQLYFAGDPYLPPNDSCSGCGSNDPARVIELTPGSNGRLVGEFRIVLARA
jgi:catechol 1,2-dioxygenase